MSDGDYDRRERILTRVFVGATAWEVATILAMVVAGAAGCPNAVLDWLGVLLVVGLFTFTACFCLLMSLYSGTWPVTARRWPLEPLAALVGGAA